MRHFNKFLRHLSLVYFAVLGVILFIPMAPFFIFFALLACVFPAAMNAYFFIMLWGVRLYLRLSPIKYQHKDLAGLGDLSSKQCLIVANHRSHLDMFIFLAEAYRVRALTNAYLLRAPLLGQMIWLSGHIIVRAGDLSAHKRALETIKTALGFGDKVLIFPEGTRCLPGTRSIGTFRMTAFQMARENNVDIIPVVIAGTDRIWPKGEMGLNFSGRISARALAPVGPMEFASSAELASHVHGLMQAELERLLA